MPLALLLVCNSLQYFVKDLQVYETAYVDLKKKKNSRKGKQHI